MSLPYKPSLAGRSDMTRSDMNRSDANRPDMARPDMDSAEAHMRQALGLQKGSASHAPQQQPDQARQRHRFVRDGEVPVVMLSSRKDPEADGIHGNRLAALDAALHSERAARAAAERGLHEAQASVLSLQTKLAHAELAHREALASERARCELADRGREQAERRLQEAVAAQEAAEQELQRIAAAPVALPVPVVAAPSHTAAPKSASPKAASPKAGRMARAPRAAAKAGTAPKREPQPVKWWLPDYRAKVHGT